MNSPSSYPTTSDISAFMQSLGFKWSNQARVYYHDSSLGYEYVSRKTAETIYLKLLGENPYYDTPKLN